MSDDVVNFRAFVQKKIFDLEREEEIKKKELLQSVPPGFIYKRILVVADHIVMEDVKRGFVEVVVPIPNVLKASYLAEWYGEVVIAEPVICDGLPPIDFYNANVKFKGVQKKTFNQRANTCFVYKIKLLTEKNIKYAMKGL